MAQWAIPKLENYLVPTNRMVQCVVALAFALPLFNAHSQTSCHADTSQPSDADVARYRQEYGTAAKLYSTLLASSPGDPGANTGLIETRIGEGKFKEARVLADAFATANAGSAQAHAARAQILAAQLQVVDATVEIRKAFAADPCSGRAFLIAAEIEQANSKFAMAWSHLQVAHKLSPNDDDVLRAWMWANPTDERHTLWAAYLASSKFVRASEVEDINSRVLESKAAAHSGCTVIANKGGTTVQLEHAADSGTLEAEVHFGTVKRNFTVSAHRHGIVISEALATLIGAKKLDSFQDHAYNSAGSFDYWIAVIPEFTIGDITFRNCTTTVQAHTIFNVGTVGLDTFSDFLVDFDPAGTLKISALPPLPATVAHAADKWSSPSTDANGFLSHTQGLWQPYDAIVPQGMESWDHIHLKDGALIAMAQVGPGPALPFDLSWSQHFDVLNYTHQSDAVSLKDTAKVLGTTIPKQTLDAFGAYKYFVSIQGHVLPVPEWRSRSYDNALKDIGLDLAGTLGYTTIGNLRMTIDFRDGLAQFNRTSFKQYPGF